MAYDDDDDPMVDAVRAVARSINNLGNADAATSMGGLEALGKVMSESLDRVADALRDVARAIDDHHD